MVWDTAKMQNFRIVLLLFEAPFAFLPWAPNHLEKTPRRKNAMGEQGEEGFL